MKRMLRYLAVLVFMCGFASAARADDFQMVVIDPNVAATPIYSNDFSITLTPCTSAQLDGLSPSTYLGCFTGENESGSPLTSLQLLIPVFDYNNQVDQPGCSPVTQDIFADISCGFTNNNQDYYVDFSGGSIPSSSANNNCWCGNDDTQHSAEVELCNPDSIFTIAVAGVPPSSFPTDIPVVANTPEPNSLCLMLTGLLAGGLCVFGRRRSLVSIQ